MPVPRFMAHFNKRFLNSRQVSKGVRPVLTHVGRSSGKTRKTPLDADRVEGGYIFTLMYGSESDWVKNILAAGKATLTIESDEVALVSPRLITKEDASKQLNQTAKPPPGFLRVTEYLYMDQAKA